MDFRMYFIKYFDYFKIHYWLINCFAAILKNYLTNYFVSLIN